MIVESVEDAKVVILADADSGAEGLETVELKSQVEETSEIVDANGIITDWTDIYVITGVGYSVVFFVLILLIYVYKLLPKILNLQVRKRLKREGKEIDSKSQYVAGEVNAAIATALILYFNEQHDEESNIITIKRVARNYSPWSSKIYGINNVFSSR
jgi:glutaconyl-CoA/methylmalonyl-CoA decarboxylase subunit delta